jgi:CheY-like chemotaxis protein/MinD-like ATPase involved in chromosome partitioning or flagellar assembly
MAEKILVVDDDLDTLRLVGMMLERQGFQILAASNGEQALAKARAELPDLILLDLMMPDIDGVEVARQLRADPQTRNILIIMFTAKGQTEDKIEGLDAGADDYITKPAQPRELIAHVKAVLKRSRKSAAVARKKYSKRGRLIGVLAAKGGVGVTTVAVNFGIALRERHKKAVLVADFRPGSGTMGLDLGYTIAKSSIRFLQCNPGEINPAAIEEELQQHSSEVRFLLSSPQPQDAQYACAVENFAALAQNLTYLADYIVLDLGVSLTPANQKVIELCDQIVLVLEPVPQTVMQSKILLNYLSGQGYSGNRTLVALVNRLRAGMQLTLGQVQDLLGQNVSAIFTAMPELAYQALIDHSPMIVRQPDGIVAKQFAALVDKIGVSQG